MRQVKIILFAAAIFCTIAVACSKDGASADSAGNSTGTGGSMARFTIAANHLYIADCSELKVFDLNNAANPVLKKTVNVGWGIETIFPYKDKLFIGSRDGMFIYSITNPSSPVKLGSALHVRSCDPVVANDSIAYVTLRGGSPCGTAQDALYIYDIKNITAPVQKSLLPLSNPYGLGLKDSVVFVCRGANGLSAVNVKNPASPKLMYTINQGNFTDVIPYNNLLICYVSTGLLLYDISNLESIVKVGTINY